MMERRVCREHFSYPAVRPVRRPMPISVKKWRRHMRRHHGRR